MQRLEPLKPHLEPILDAFWSMHPARFSGMGHRPLGLSDIMDWCAFRDIQSLDYRDRLWWFILRLDQVWLELADEDAERRRQNAEWEASHDD